MIHTETWKQIYGGVYEVSDLGSLRRVAPWCNRKRAAIGLRRAFTDKDGYLRTKLTVNGKQFKRHLHQLVLEAFEGPCPPGKQVNHKNGVKNDNRLENLEYVTPLENIRHAWRELGLKGHHTQGKLTEREVRLILSLRESKSRYLAQMFGVSRPTITRILAGVRWGHLQSP